MTAEVAVPISRGETAFCTAVTMGCMLPPRPRPISSMMAIVAGSGVSAVIRENRKSAINISAEPTIGMKR